MLTTILRTIAILALLAWPSYALAQAEGDPTAPATVPFTLPSGDSLELKKQLSGWDRSGADLSVEFGARIHLQKPVAVGYLSSVFGIRTDPFTGIVRAHRGLDIVAPAGTPIFASEDGVVSIAGTTGGYGRMIQITHRAGIQTRYGHLSRILVRPGEPIRRGALIGLVGSSGRSTGYHLHYEVRIDGQPLDPARPLPAPSSDPSWSVDARLSVTEHWRGWHPLDNRLPSAF